MSGVSKKFGFNITKKNAKKRTGERDELDIPGKNLSSLSPNLSQGHHGMRSGGKSSSLGSIHSEMDEELDQEDIMALTHNVRSFSDALHSLKQAITVDGSSCAEDVKIATLDKLGEVLHILRGVLQKYPVLQSTDVLTAAAILIAKIKSYNYDDLGNDGSELQNAVDQLAMAFSSSVSEYLMGDIDSYPCISKSKSYDNLASRCPDTVDGGDSDRVYESLSANEMDERLHQLEAGMDIAFERAKSWARYAKEIITYVEKRAHLEAEFSKGLTKLANSVKTTITEDTFLPFQSVYCTALDQDTDFASANQATCGLLATHKFVDPLNSRKLEHEKSRKHLRDTWAKEMRKMQESVTNLKKARNAYISRKQDHEKAKESAYKAEAENLSQSTGSTLSKLEKKKKQEDDALFRSKEAEITYQTCVLEANNSQKELEKIRAEILGQIRELIHHSDQIMKAVTTSYFQLLYSAYAALPLQFQVLADSSSQYEPGCQYMEYIRRLPATKYSPPEQFVFQQYYSENRSDGGRKPSTHSSGSGSDLVYGDDSPHLSPRSVSVPSHHKVDEEDSISGSSCKSSPSASPYPMHRGLTNSTSATSMSELLGDHVDARYGGGSSAGVSAVFRGVCLSRAAQTHVFKKLRAPSRCRQCETYVFLQGAECEKCGLSSHKKCLEHINMECDHRGSGAAVDARSHRRMTTFGVDFSAQVQENQTQIPQLITKCVQKIDQDGIELKGIFRVSGVKSKVDKLCHSFETEPASVDLTDHQPHVVANVLKLYLRQLPEPLFTFALYPELMRIAKENIESGNTPDAMVPALKTLILGLPKPNVRTLSHLMHHLHRVCEHEHSNHMTATNLGIVFGPTLLRPREGAASLDSLMDTPSQTRIIQALITDVQTIFGEEEGGSSVPNKSPRLDVVDEAGAGDSTDDGRIGWFVPEITENLLDELAREEPRFQQMGSGEASTDQPADSSKKSPQPQAQPQSHPPQDVDSTQGKRLSSGHKTTGLPKVASSSLLPSTSSTSAPLEKPLLKDLAAKATTTSTTKQPPTAAKETTTTTATTSSAMKVDARARQEEDKAISSSGHVIASSSSSLSVTSPSVISSSSDDDDYDDWELADSLLPDQSNNTSLASLKPPQPSSHQAGAGGQSLTPGPSPGLRRKLLPSQVMPGSAPDLHLIPPLTKPQPYSPPPIRLQPHHNKEAEPKGEGLEEGKAEEGEEEEGSTNTEAASALSKNRQPRYV